MQPEQNKNKAYFLLDINIHFSMALLRLFLEYADKNPPK